MLKTAAGWAAAVLTALWCAAAAADSRVNLANTDDAREIARIEEYLNGITTLRSRFVQANPDGSYSEGILYLQRPGDLRFEYDPPDPYLIVTKDGWLVYIDKELAQATYFKVEKTPAAFIINANTQFGENVEITSFSRGDGSFRLGLKQKNEPDAGVVTLIFTDKPLTLRKWTVLDAQGNETDTTLINPEYGVSFSQDVFFFQEPGQ